MPTTLQTPVAVILTWIKTQLVQVTGLQSSQIYLTLLDNPPHFQGDQELVIRPLDPIPDELTEGAGRVAFTISRPILVTIRSRTWTDLADAQADRMIASHAVLEESVLNALHDIVPNDGNGNNYCVEPMHLDPSVRLDKAPNDGVDWMQSRLVFSMKYLTSLDQTVVF